MQNIMHKITTEFLKGSVVKKVIQRYIIFHYSGKGGWVGTVATIGFRLILAKFRPNSDQKNTEIQTKIRPI